MDKTTEVLLERTALDWFGYLGWATAFGPNISTDGPVQERGVYDQVVLIGRLQTALAISEVFIPILQQFKDVRA